MKTSHKKKIAHLSKGDPVLAIVIKGAKLQMLARKETGEYFEALVESIVSQQLSVKVADTIFNRFIALTPGKKFPTPREILKMPAAKMRKCGLSGMKVAFIKDLSRKILDGSLDLKKIDMMSDEEVIKHLIQVKGIGQWTAEMFLMFSLGRDDVFSYGDLALRNAMQRVYKMKKTPTPAQAAKITGKWSPYRTLGSRYLWASLRKET
ncbi:MAG TPA: DNA-3-methyladenine glycosylase [Candidatus Paceibacterota bacterium]|nr:DNA-3-methyladenine glycosylase [Candidatus Paceibacterota bacterium]